MSEEVRLPEVSPGLQKAIIIEWLKNEGDAVKMGEPLSQIETDKAADGG